MARLGIAVGGSVISLLTIWALAAAPRADADLEQKQTVLFLVRHAEKTDSSTDPKLSSAGKKRAAQLVTLLRDAEIQRVHSSDYLRTRNTAAPVAAAASAKLELYDPRDLASLAGKLRKAGGRHLVVGHSNTTPQLVRLLGGKPGGPINEKGEYDRLYMLTLHSDGTTTTVLLRFGKAYRPIKK